MGYTGTDTYGNYVDTGCASAPAPRASVEVEFHATGEVDTASKNTIPQTVASHGPHREPKSPR